MAHRLLIIGASARAAAMSAIRSGFEPWAADHFGDLDLRACAPTVHVVDYPAGLERVFSAAPTGPWMYTGALENRPELIARLSRTRRLYGVSGESLRAVRDPFQLASALAKAGLSAPGCARFGAELPRDIAWLRKPLASAGGCGVRSCSGESVANEPVEHAAKSYFQQRIDGLPVGAVYVAADRRAELLGVTRQLIGLEWCGLPSRGQHRYRYCGSIGPLLLAPAMASRFSMLGNALAEAFDLRGLFGVDAIIADDDIWPIEVNPRYTASVEILERVSGVRSIARHVAAWGGDTPLPSVQPESARGPSCGKAILFAIRDTIVTPEFADWCFGENPHGRWPVIADIPAGGTAIHAGQPIATVFGSGADETAVLARLKSLALSVADVIARREPSGRA
jgi:predicted ATP-grasp superfamily ATP-dependent carboligase